LSQIEGDVVIAAHSAGALMVAHWGIAPTRSIRGALLATPADVENPLPAGYPSYPDLKANGWVPIPRKRLPFRTIVAASGNDPLAQFEKIAGLARAWGAELQDIGEVGHLNPAAGYGPWDGGLPLLERLAAS
jgi:predicted alpha/beta hydrolase family esterase